MVKRYISVEQGNATMKTGNTLKKARGFLSRLRRDESGNTLAMVAAGIFPLIGMVGGAADMSRAYMTKARMQQACDAGALAARRAMSTGTLTVANKNTGYQFFDFNFPSGSYGSTLVSREYTQPVVNSVTQTIVNGRAEATVPTMLMQVFGKEQLEVIVTCTSTQDVANADVAMVLDVTGSMNSSMPLSSTGTATTTRIAALRQSVRAFYNSLGPGRAGGDLSKGRIRYAFIPYGTTVNNAYLLTNNHLVDQWSYQSRLAVARSYWGWTETGTETFSGYSDYSPTIAPANALNVSNYNGPSDVSGGGSITITNADGSTSTMDKVITVVPAFPGPGTVAATSSTCGNANTLAPNIAALSHSFGSAGTETLGTTSTPVHPDATRNRTYSNPRTVTPAAYKYEWRSSQCRLRLSTNKSAARWTQTRGRTSTRPLSWQNYTGHELVYGQVSTNVSVLKAGGSSWNNSLTMQMSITNPVSYSNIKLSGSTTNSSFTLGTAANNTVSFLGCTEDRTTDTSINGSTSISSIPSGAIDMQFSTLASTGDDNTRWKPYLHNMVFDTNGSSKSSSNILDECPSPALKLAEYATYNSNITTNYPNLFSNSTSITSLYYPRQSNALLNAPTLQNYIDRVRLTDGTLHDVGFIWGMHLLSGQGMFASENPDTFNNVPVNRHIVFMTDGEMNPGEERYVFSGFNQRDGRLAPASTSDSGMKQVQNRRLRMMCENAKQQGIIVWVVAITGSTPQDYADLEACASAPENFKTASNQTDLVNSFTVIGQAIGGLRISE
jgi:Flp pilus assembly protein TadG